MNHRFLSFLLVISALGSVSEAQTQAQKVKTFQTASACEAALASGNYVIYEPTYFNLNSRNPVNGVDRIVVALESNMCMKMLIVGGPKFVVQREGTKFRAYKNADGSLTLYARDDCGNPVFGVDFPAPPERTYQGVTLEVPVFVPPPPPLTIPVQSVVRVPAPQRDSTRWGITGSALVGQFDSVPIGRGLESLTNRTVCVKGRGFDLGVSHGRQGSSLWRLTVASKSFKEGSFTKYPCPTCAQEVKIVAAAGVRVLGAQLERVQGFNSTKWRGIRPMVSVNGGVGRISGEAHRHMVRGGITETMHTVVDSKELFGSRWVPMAGAGVGVMGNIGKHVTYAVTLVGVEYPGVYYGRVTLTIRP